MARWRHPDERPQCSLIRIPNGFHATLIKDVTPNTEAEHALQLSMQVASIVVTSIKAQLNDPIFYPLDLHDEGQQGHADLQLDVSLKRCQKKIRKIRTKSP